MALVKKCDRCGATYEPYNQKQNAELINGILTLNIDMRQNYFTNTIIDLCPDCCEKFNMWLKDPKCKLKHSLYGEI